MVKKARQSKTMWTGAAVTLFSIASILVDTWGLLAPSDRETLKGLFGPDTFALLGVVMVVLRVMTSKPVVRRP